MELFAAIDALNASPPVRDLARVAAVEALPTHAPSPVLNAHVCTGFEPAACMPDLSGAGIAAAAAAQDLRLFTSTTRRARPDRPG